MNTDTRSTAGTGSPGKKTFFYGWVLCGACMLMLCATSLLSTGMSTSLAALKNDVGLTATQTSGVLLVRGISAFALTFFADRYFQKLGIRIGTAVAMLFGAVVFLIFAAAGTSVPMYYLGGAVAGITYAYGLMLPASMLMKKWFNKSRGKALSIAAMGTGLASAVGAPSIQFLLNRYGVRTAFLAQAAFMLLVAVILFLLVVNDPAEKGLEPYGGAGFTVVGKKPVSEGKHGLSTFWMLAIGLSVFIIGSTASPLISHFTLNFTEAGIDAMTVASAISVYGVGIIAAKYLLGHYLDRFGTKSATLVFGTIVSAAYVLCGLIRWIPSAPLMFATLIVYALGASILTLGYPNWCADLDPGNYAVTLKRWQLFYQLGALAGSSLPGIIADLTGSYSWAYLFSGLLNSIAFMIVLLAYRAFRVREI